MKFTDVLKLEVESSAPLNLINITEPLNDDAQLDGWSEGVLNTWDLQVNNLPTVKSGDQILVVEGEEVAVGVTLAATQVSVGGGENATVTLGVEWLDADRASLSVTTGTIWSVTDGSTWGAIDGYATGTAPAGARYAQLYLLDETNHPGSWNFHISKPWLVKGTDVSLLDFTGDLWEQTRKDLTKWTDLMGDSNEIQVVREGLDVGTLTAVVLDKRFDPTRSSIVRKGHNIRLVALVNGSWEPIYTGKINDAEVTYNAKVAGTQYPDLLATNHFPDPSFEYGLIYSSMGSAGITSMGSDTTHVHTGTTAMKVVNGPGPGAGVGLLITDLKPNTEYTFSAWAYSPASNTGTLGVRVGTTVSSVETWGSYDTTRDAWVQLSVTDTSDADGLLFVSMDSSEGATDETWWDDACVVEGAAVLEDFSGDTNTAGGSGWTSWEGIPGDSRSEMWQWLSMGPKGTRIQLTAVDQIKSLAGTPDPNGRPSFGSSSVVSYNPDASALDQIALTRDSVSGYAWVDRANVLQTVNGVDMPTATQMSLSPDKVSNLDVSFDTDRCINSVKITWLRYDSTTGDTTEVVYGPYVDQASVDEWGEQKAEFTLHGLVESPAAMQQYAERIFALQGAPRVKVIGAELPVRFDADLDKGLPLVDLYDLLTVPNNEAKTVSRLRVTHVEHNISTASGWLMSLGFADPEAIQTPRPTPPPAKPADPTESVPEPESGTPVLVRKNWVLDPSFETGVGGWTTTNPTALAQSERAFKGSYGAMSYMDYQDGGYDIVLTSPSYDVPLDPKATVKVRIFVPGLRDSLAGLRNPQFQLSVEWYDTSSVLISTTDGAVTPILDDRWVSLTEIHTKPAGADTCRIKITHKTTEHASAGSTHFAAEFHVDALMLTEGAYTGEYGDGDSGGGWTWNGTPNAATSSLIKLEPPLTGPVGTPGVVQLYAGDTLPDGWLLCDGSELSRGTYANLFAAIGTSYGAGDGTNTFNLPDLQGRVAVGFDSTQTEFDSLGETGGEKEHTLTIAEMPAHAHGQNMVNTAQHDNNYVYPSVGSSANGGISTGHEVTQSTGGDGAHNNLQPYVVMNYIISY